ncbi:MAG: putative glycoside hydrolase [Candidatus Gracilibacteria bacterium]|jgi:hypothetical protein
MQITFRNFFIAHPLRKTKQWLSFISFGVFFLILQINLTAGNSFIALAEASQPEVQLQPTKVYQPLVAAIQDEYENQWKEMEIAHALRGEKKAGVYIHMNNIANQKFLKPEIEELKQFKNASVIFDVKGSFVYFATDSAIAKKYGLVKPLYDLPAIIQQFKAAGIYTVARVIAVKDSEFYWKNNATVALKSPYTGNVVAEWVDPANSEVLDYNREVISEILDAGIDEINLDFIRYPDKVTNNFLGITSAEKMANIENFVKRVREVIDSKPNKAIFSIDTFAIVGLDFDANAGPLGQNVKALAPYVDIIAPMLYPSTFGEETVYYDPKVDKGGRSYSLVKKTLLAYQQLLGEEEAHKLRPWIQGYYMEKSDLIQQIKGVYDAGYCGFLVWNIFNDYTLTYAAMREVEVPAHCSEN